MASPKGAQVSWFLQENVRKTLQAFFTQLKEMILNLLSMKQECAQCHCNNTEQSMTSAGTLHKPAPKSPPGCPWWGHSAVPHHPQGFGPAVGLHCKHLHTLISHRHGKHLCCQLTKEHPGMETHTKVSVITIWKQDQPILQLLPQNMGISSLFVFFLNSDRLLNSCSNLQTACASTQNTAEDKKKTRLLELHMPVVRGFLELHMSPTGGDLFLQLPQILSVLAHWSSVFIYIFKSLHCDIF